MVQRLFGSKSNQAVAADNVSNLALDLLEPHKPATFAFKVVDDAGKVLEVHPTRRVGAMIQGLLI